MEPWLVFYWVILIRWCATRPFRGLQGEALTDLPVCKPSERPGVLRPVTPPQLVLGHVQGFHLCVSTARRQQVK